MSQNRFSDATLEKELERQIKKPPHKNAQFYHIDAPKGANQWQLDLADFQRLSAHNRGFTFLLVAVDVYSRLTRLYPMKSKSDTPFHIHQLVQNERVKSILTDLGSEFTNSLSQDVLKKASVSHITAPVGDKRMTALVERTIGIIRRLLFRMQLKHNRKDGPFTWFEKMRTIETELNKRKMGILGGKTPLEVYVKKLTKPHRKDPIEIHPEREKLIPKLGDLVRVKMDLGQYDKRSQAVKWSPEIFRVQATQGTRALVFQFDPPVEDPEALHVRAENVQIVSRYEKPDKKTNAIIDRGLNERGVDLLAENNRLAVLVRQRRALRGANLL